MSILKSRVYKEKIGRTRANFQVLLENVGHFHIDGVLRHNCCHICLRTDDARVTLPHPKHNTSLSDEEQVWDVSGIGIREPEKDLK